MHDADGVDLEYTVPTKPVEGHRTRLRREGGDPGANKFTTCWACKNRKPKSEMHSHGLCWVCHIALLDEKPAPVTVRQPGQYLVTVPAGATLSVDGVPAPPVGDLGEALEYVGGLCGDMEDHDQLDVITQALAAAQGEVERLKGQRCPMCLKRLEESIRAEQRAEKAEVDARGLRVWMDGYSAFTNQALEAYDKADK